MTSSICHAPYPGSVYWLLVYIFIILMSVIGNTLTIIAIFSSRKLKNLLSNRFVLSLAVSDLLVGFSLPYHMFPHYWSSMDRDKVRCLFRFTLIAFACSSSIYNLLLVAADRYVAIVHPLHYNKYMTRRVSLVCIGCAWTLGLGLGTPLLYWNKWQANGGVCDISLAPEVYLNYLMAPLFVSVWCAMLVFYVRIVREAKSQARRLKHAVSVSSLPGLYEPSRSLQMVFVILGCFTVTWLPFVLCITIIKTSGIYCLLLYEISFSMAAANSAMNPLIYAWKNNGFRESFGHLLRCRSPNACNNADYVTNHTPSKGNTLRPDNNKEGGGYCNGRPEDLIKSERAAIIDDRCCWKGDYDGESELTVESELSNVNGNVNVNERIERDFFVDQLL